MSSPTAVLLGVLIGILCIDLKHDFNPDVKFAQHYYNGQMNFFFPVVEAIIGLLGVSIIVETFFLRKGFFTKLAFLGLISSVGIFVLKLIPLESSLKLNQTVEEITPIVQEIKQWHLVVLGIVVYGVFAFALTHCEKPKKEKNN